MSPRKLQDLHVLVKSTHWMYHQEYNYILNIFSASIVSYTETLSRTASGANSRRVLFLYPRLFLTHRRNWHIIFHTTVWCFQLYTLLWWASRSLKYCMLIRLEALTTTSTRESLVWRNSFFSPHWHTTNSSTAGLSAILISSYAEEMLRSM
jgi:hypothetical protein